MHLRAKCGISTGQLVFCGLSALYCIKVTSETINTIGCQALKIRRFCPKIFSRGLDRFASCMQEFMTHMGMVEIHSLTPPTRALMQRIHSPTASNTGRVSLTQPARSSKPLIHSNTTGYTQLDDAHRKNSMRQSLYVSAKKEDTPWLPS